MERTISVNATTETVTFIKSTDETNGQYLEFTVTLKAGGKGPGLHSHPFQTETFEIMEGVVGVQLGDQILTLSAGQKVEIPAGIVHNFWCADNQNIKFKAVVTPALNFEWMIRELFASCNRNKSADPSIFDGAFVLSKLKGEYILGDIPKLVQKNIFPIIAGIGNLIGLVKAKSK